MDMVFLLFFELFFTVQLVPVITEGYINYKKIFRDSQKSGKEIYLTAKIQCEN